MRPRCLPVYSDDPLDKVKGGVFVLHGYSMRKVSKKEEKRNKRLSRRQAAQRCMEVRSDVKNLLSCREGCDVEHKATGAKNGTALIDADL